MAVGEAHGSRGWNPECSQRSPTEPPGVAQPSATVLQQSMAQLYDGKLSLPGEAHHTPQGVREDLMKTVRVGTEGTLVCNQLLGMVQAIRDLVHGIATSHPVSFLAV